MSEDITPKGSMLVRDFKRFPSLKAWVISLAATAIFLSCAWLVMPGFINLNAQPAPAEMVFVILVALFFPALCEEIVFRGIFNRTQSPASITLSTAAFVAWHPIGAFLFLKEAIPWFLDPKFLTFVAIFGLMSCLMRKFSKSLWPSIVSHWIVVVVWKGLGGTQFLTP